MVNFILIKFLPFFINILIKFYPNNILTLFLYSIKIYFALNYLSNIFNLNIFKQFYILQTPHNDYMLKYNSHHRVYKLSYEIILFLQK